MFERPALWCIVLEPYLDVRFTFANAIDGFLEAGLDGSRAKDSSSVYASNRRRLPSAIASYF